MRLSKKLLACLTAAMLMMAMLTVALAQEGVEEDFMEGVVRVTGEGVGKAAYKGNPGKFRLSASKAARMDAQAKLVEYLSVQVKTNARMAGQEAEEYNVEVEAQGVIRNAREVGSPQYNPTEGTCTVVMVMPMFGGQGSVAAFTYMPFKDEPKVSFPQPVNANQSTVANKNYTGLIIDCSGTGKQINCVMSPVIKNGNGQEIYGHKNLDYDKIIVQGMASYANSTNDQISQSRAGSNPLIVKAIRLDDLNANPVVSVEDADKILAANQHDGFLDRCAVVFAK